MIIKRINNNCLEGTETSICDTIHDTFHVQDLKIFFFQFQETAMPRKSFNKMKYHFHHINFSQILVHRLLFFQIMLLVVGKVTLEKIA